MSVAGNEMGAALCYRPNAAQVATSVAVSAGDTTSYVAPASGVFGARAGTGFGWGGTNALPLAIR